MTNQEYLAILKQGVEVWNKWRDEYQDVVLDLHKGNINNEFDVDYFANKLRGADLRGADLRGADLRGAKLGCVHLSEADIERGVLRKEGGVWRGFH